MIPLRLTAVSPAPAPFVVRLRSEAPYLAIDETVSPFDAILENVESTTAGYSTPYGSLEITAPDPAEIENDVLLVDPRRGVAHRLIRAASAHNTLLVTERCDQLCSMCSQPPKEHHVDMFPIFEIAAQLAPQQMLIGISGGEPTLYKAQLFEFLMRTFATRPDLQFHILTNGQHFEEEDLPVLVGFPMERIVWGIPLYSSRASEHDRIVGKAGAFQRLQRSMAVLCRAGAGIELRTVVIKDNAQHLPELARFIATNLPFVSTWALMQLENIGFGRMNWSQLFWDHSKDYQPLQSAIDVARARGIDTLLYNFPLCTVPEAHRRLAPATISDWKRRYLNVCDTCSKRAGCGGFFEWYPESRGFQELRAL